MAKWVSTEQLKDIFNYTRTDSVVRFAKNKNVQNKVIKGIIHWDFEQFKEAYESKTTIITGDFERDKEVIRLRDENKQLRALYKKVQSKEAFQDEILKIIKSDVQALPLAPWKEVPILEKGVDPEEAVLFVSDLHTAEVVDYQQMGGLNQYNFQLFLKRLQWLSDSVRHISRTHLSNYKFEKLHLLLGGDFVCGDIHDELIETSEMNVMDASLACGLIMAQFIREFCAEFKKVEVDGIVGNHGRIRKQKYYKNKYANWDYVTYQIIGALLKDQPNVKFNFPKSFFLIKKINGYNFLLLHGDDIRSWMGIPWYGVNRMVAQLTEILASRSIFIDYVCLAHFHNTATLDKCIGEKMINGSFVGGSEFSLGKTFQTSDPKQLFWGVHERQGVTWRFPINLKFGDTRVKNIRYIWDSNIPIGEQMR